MYTVYSVSHEDTIVYIGATKQTLRARWRGHSNSNSEHTNRPLGKLIARVDKNALRIDAIQANIPDKKIANQIESAAIALWSPICNVCPNGNGFRNNTGKKYSLKTRQRLSKSKSGKNHHFHQKSLSEETRKKIAESRKDRITNSEIEKILSLSNAGASTTEIMATIKRSRSTVLKYLKKFDRY